jgi:hypothetical protein
METFLLPGKQILFPQQCFHGWANMETFEETSRITNVSATMFPSLPRALQTFVTNPSKLRIYNISCYKSLKHGFHDMVVTIESRYESVSSAEILTTL